MNNTSKLEEIQKNIVNLQKKLKDSNTGTRRKKSLQNQITKNKSEKRRLQSKLTRVISKADLVWMSGASLVEINDKINGHPLPFDTACWTYNEIAKQEKIIFSPKIIKSLQIKLLVLVLKHEILHKSMYRGTKEVANKELLNFVLDAAINKILWLSNPKPMAELGDWLCPPNSKKRYDVLSLVNPSLTTEDFNKMTPRLRSIVEEIWWVPEYVTNPKDGLTIDIGKSCCEHYELTKKFGNSNVPDPMTLYNRLSAILSKEEKEKIKKVYAFISASDKEHARGGEKVMRANDKNTIALEDKISKEILEEVQKEGQKQDGRKWRRGDGYSTYQNMQALFEKYIYSKQDTSTQGINDFIRNFETAKQIEGVCQTIHETFRRKQTIDPYPNELTRTGLELVSLGVSGAEMPYFFNNTPHDEGSKKKVCCYFDTSPSMDAFIPFMLSVTDYIDSCEEAEITGGNFNGHYAFSEKVKGIPDSAWEDFKEGKIHSGGGTSFEAVIQHAIERIDNDQVDIILVFTDGYSGLRQETIDKFNESGKKCYSLYFSHRNYSYGHDRYSYDGQIKGLSEQGMYSDLDKLNGQSFTIFCEES